MTQAITNLQIMNMDRLGYPTVIQITCDDATTITIGKDDLAAVLDFAAATEQSTALAMISYLDQMSAIDLIVNESNLRYARELIRLLAN